MKPIHIIILCSMLVVSENFNISRHTLNDLLAEFTDGLSFPQYINNLRLEEALRLLRDEPDTTSISKTLSLFTKITAFDARIWYVTQMRAYVFFRIRLFMINFADEL